MFKNIPRLGHQAAIVICFLCVLSLSVTGSLWKAEAQPVFLPAIFKNYPIPNGNFDLGRDGSWTESSSHGFALILIETDLNRPGEPQITPQSGSWAAWLGGTDLETSILSQTIPVPPNATFLNYYYWIESFDPGDTTDPLNPICNFDTAEVRLGANILQTYDLCTLTDTNGWVLAKINISALRGQTLELSFQVVTDDLANSWSNFFLDTIFFSVQ